jgi:isopenicillin N synthase-like dioxygenase
VLKNDLGFFYIKNHPISKEDIDDIFSISQRFFAQDDLLKSRVPYDASTNAGYKPATPGYPREGFCMNKYHNDCALLSTNLPPILADHRSQIASFQRQCHAFATQLLELISLALDLPSETFTSRHQFQMQNFDNFEIMHYPPLQPIEAESPEATIYRLAPHTDWGTITLLFMNSQKPIPGLEVRPPSYISPTPSLDVEKWTPAPPIPGTILINIADMLEFWSAGRLKSTWHRVVSPPLEFTGLGRYSIAYFLHPDKSAVLEPIKSLERDGWTPRYKGRGRTAEEHIHARIRSKEKQKGAESVARAVSVAV